MLTDKNLGILAETNLPNTCILCEVPWIYALIHYITCAWKSTQAIIVHPCGEEQD